MLGSRASTLAEQGGMLAAALLLVGLLPHALPELIALFLPLAAWLVASRRGAGTSCSPRRSRRPRSRVPVLVAAAFVEVFVSPDVILAAARG